MQIDFLGDRLKVVILAFPWLSGTVFDTFHFFCELDASPKERAHEMYDMLQF